MAETLIEPVPQEILERLRMNLGSERVLIQAEADLDSSLRFASRWLVVTYRKVLLVGSGEFREVDLEEVRAARVDGLAGGGRLVLRDGSRELVALYFTSSAMPKFVQVAAGIERLIHKGGVGALEVRNRSLCESCGRLLPEKNGACPACLDRWAMLRRLASQMSGYRLAWAALLTVLLAATVAELAVPLAVQRLVDYGLSPGTALRTLFRLVTLLAVARLSIWFFETVRGRLSAWLGATVTAVFRKLLFDRVIHFSARSIDSWSVGTLLSRFVNDVARLEEFLGSGAPMLVMTALLLAALVVFLGYLSPRILTPVLAPVPLILVWTWFFWRRLRKSQDVQSLSIGRLSTQITESLNGIRVVKAFCQEGAEYRRFRERNDRVRDASAKAEGNSFVFFTVLYFLMNVGVFLVWYAGGSLVLQGSLTAGTLLAAISYLWMLYWPLQWFGQISNSVSQAMTGAAQILMLTESPVEEMAEIDATAVRRFEGNVSFRNVAFGYDPNRPVLSDIDFEVRPGEVVGIIGRSGTGKTTLMNLLARVYEVDGGSILIDNTDIREYGLDELRRQIAIVPQETFLFDGTIEANIRYGRPAATFGEVVAAARMANAHRFILERPDGYDSLVGTRGERLSGGERQRIAIARALLADPRILILDEATSALDVESEKAIQGALARATSNRTTFIIAHRLSTIRGADRLIVLDRGRIAEKGTYSELLDRKGLLYEFANAYSETWGASA